MYIYSRWNIACWPDDRCAGSMLDMMFKIIYSSPYASHETTTSYIVKTYMSIQKRNVYINVHLQSMERRGTSDRIQCQDSEMALFWLFSLLSTHMACTHIQIIPGYAPARLIAISLHMYEKVFHYIWIG